MDTGWVNALLTPEVARKSLDILLAGLIVLLAVVLSRLLKRWLDAAMERTRIKDDLLLRSFFLRMLSIATIIIGALVALRVLGLDVPHSSPDLASQESSSALASRTCCRTLQQDCCF